MKFLIFLKLFLFFSLFSIIDYQVFAQAPESMNYQAVIRDGSGNIVASQSVGIRIKILEGSTSGSSVYEETFAPTTNAYGSIAIQIGTGTVVTGTFNTIDWGGNTHFVETAVDISGGTNYTVISNTQLMSVPYALHAKSSDAWSTNSNLNFTNNKVSVGNISITNHTYPLSVVSVHDGIVSRGIDVLRTDNTGTNMGVPMSFSLLNSNNQPFEFGKVVGRTQSNTSGAEVGSLSFQVADGTTWGQNYEQERMRIDNEMITINAKNTANSEATLRLRGTNSNGDHSQLVDMKSAVDGHVTSSKFTIATRNQGTMNDHFVIDSEGKVGIGTTSSPTKKLSVEHDDGFSSGEHILANISRTTPTSGVAGLYFGYYADGTEETGGIVRSMGNLPLYLGTFSHKQLLTVGYNSNVGIGTNTPNSLLDINNGYISLSGIGSQSGIVSNVDLGTFKLYCGPYTGNTSNGFWFRASDSLGQVDSFTDLFKIEPHDVDVVRVGVGTMSPQRNLHINDVMRLEPRPTAPSNPSKGDIYMDDSDNTLKYYNGTSWENVAGSSSSSNSHYIGESYGGGIVFFVYDNGQHGLIAATSDQSSGVRWFGGSYRVTRARADGVLAGLKNTSIIIADQAATDGSSFAATLCNEYSVTVNGVIYGDWYLPSKYELNLLYLQRNLVGGFSNFGYWTSTEMDFSNGWAQNMGDGLQFGYLKNFTYRVRAIRAF